MRVLHIITGLNDGGAEGVLYRLITHNPHDAHYVVSMTGEGKYGRLLRARGVEVIDLAMPRGSVIWPSVFGLWRKLRAIRPDVVQTWMYHANLVGGVLARLAGIPVIWGIRSTLLEKNYLTRTSTVVTRICGCLSHWIPARIISCAKAAVDAHSRLGYDAARMVVIPNGYDLSLFAPDSATCHRLRRQWDIPDNVPLLGVVARYEPWKDHANLINALACLWHKKGKDFRAVMAGVGISHDNSELAALMQSAGLSERALLLGPRDDIHAVMGALDVYVLSSAAEAFPNVLAEAMACGTPCVVTNVGDASLIVGDTGWVVPPRNPEALADALSQAIDAMQNASAWRTRQLRCRQRIAENFSIETMVQRYRLVWKEAIMGV